MDTSQQNQKSTAPQKLSDTSLNDVNGGGFCDEILRLSRDWDQFVKGAKILGQYQKKRAEENKKTQNTPNAKKLIVNSTINQTENNAKIDEVNVITDTTFAPVIGKLHY